MNNIILDLKSKIEEVSRLNREILDTLKAEIEKTKKELDDKGIIFTADGQIQNAYSNNSIDQLFPEDISVKYYNELKFMDNMYCKQITFQEFQKVQMYCGRILEAKDFPNARKPSYQLLVDFGELGLKRSSAQITDLYSKEELIGMQVIGVTNLPRKQIANYFSEVLVLGVEQEGKITLLTLSKKTANGLRIM